MPKRNFLPLLVAVCAAYPNDAAASTPSLAASLPRIELLRAQRDWLGALALIEQQRELHPNDASLYRAEVITLLDVGSSARAHALYRAHPEWFDAGQSERLESSRLARLILWGGLYANTPQQRNEELEVARAAMQVHLDAPSSTPGTATLRTRFDEILLLNRLERHAEVVTRYERMLAESIDPPPYVLLGIADSLLAMRRPQRAAALFERVIAAMPDAFDAKLSLAYAYSESERFDAAYAWLERLRGEPPWLRVDGAKQGYANWRYYDADLNLALTHLYGHDTDYAQTRLEALAKYAPANAGLQTALGSVYIQRGWSTRGLERFRIAGTLDPEHVGAQLGQIGALLDLQRVDQARPLWQRLQFDHPLNVQVGQMKADWKARLGWQWELALASGRSDADDGSATTSPLGSRDDTGRLTVQSPLLGDRWRITGFAQTTSADYRDERPHDRRRGLGVSYAFDRLQASAGVDRVDDGVDRDVSGHSIAIGWRLDDRWNLRAQWYGNTPEASLQARQNGIRGDSSTLHLDWIPSDQARLGAGLQILRYDDGNRRDSFAVDGSSRLMTRPHLLVDGMASLYTSRATEGDVPYFNPGHDASARLGLRVDQIVWRRYDHHLRQRLMVDAGPYWQEGFGTGWVPQVQYQHEWRLGTGRKLEYGFGWSQPIYDGARETHWSADFSFRWGEG